MATYQVTIRKIEKYYVEVSAEDEQEAREIAEAKIESAPNDHHDDSDVEIECYEK